MNEKEKKNISKEALIHHIVGSDGKSCRKVSRTRFQQGKTISSGPRENEKKAKITLEEAFSNYYEFSGLLSSNARNLCYAVIAVI